MQNSCQPHDSTAVPPPLKTAPRTWWSPEPVWAFSGKIKFVSSCGVMFVTTCNKKKIERPRVGSNHQPFG